MPTTRTVTLGDHLLRIAHAERFRSFRVIWDDPANAALKRERFNPNVLDVGDVLTIPDRTPFNATRQGQVFNQFLVRAEESILNLRLETAGFEPRASRENTVVATVDATGTPQQTPPKDGRTDATGKQTLRSPNPFVEVDLRLKAGSGPNEVAEHLHFLVGQLAPLKTKHGQQARLNNLGYFAGFRPDNVEQFRWAVEEFQTDHRKGFPQMRRLGLEPDGTIDRETMIALGTVHGDLLPGQAATL